MSTLALDLDNIGEFYDGPLPVADPDDEPDDEWCPVCGKPADLCDCFAVLRSSLQPNDLQDATDILDVLEGNNDERARDD